MAHAPRPTQVSVLRTKCGARVAQASASPAVAAKSALARLARLRTLEQATLHPEVAALSPRRPGVTAAATATRSSRIPELAVVLVSTAACTSTAAPTAARPIARARLRVWPRSPFARRHTPWRTRTSASKVASFKPNARVSMPLPQLPDGGLVGDASACRAAPDSDSAYCGGTRPPHAYLCVLASLPAPCVVADIANVTDTYCCP